jgi:hypothetical protein
MLCRCCDANQDETYTHRYYDCRQARLVWTVAFSIIQRLQRAPRNYTPFRAFNFEQCIFAGDVRFRLCLIKRIWFYLRGIVLWGIWLARNDVVFHRTFWNENHIKQYVWEQLLDYGRLEWAKTLKKHNAAPPDQRLNILRAFDAVWARRKVMCTRSEVTVRWNLVPPSNLLVSW